MNKLSVLLFKEGEKWIAQCLEVDITAQADDLEEVRYRFERRPG